MELIFTDYFTFVSIDKLREEMPLNTKGRKYRIRFQDNVIEFAKFNFCNEKNVSCHMPLPPEDQDYFSPSDIQEVITICQNHVANQVPYVYYKNMVLDPNDKIFLMQTNLIIMSIEEYADNKYFYLNSTGDIINILNNYTPSTLQNVNYSTVIFAEYSSIISNTVNLTTRNIFYKVPAESFITNDTNPFILSAGSVQWKGVQTVQVSCSFTASLSLSNNSENIAIAFFKNNIEVYRLSSRIATGANSLANVGMQKIITLIPNDILDVRITNLTSSTRTATVATSVFKMYVYN